VTERTPVHLFWRAAHLCGFAALLLLTAPAAAQETTYLVRGAMLPVNRAANGWVQAVIPSAPGEVRVQVTVDMGPIGSDGVWSGPPASSRGLVPEGFRLPRELSWSLQEGDGSWQTATTVLRWVMRRTTVDVNDREPQDALSVLRRGSGRCSGVANAAVALLRTAGFEARTVSGLLVGVEKVVPHRWLECKLPGAGWVPTDPTLGVWVVTPRHVAFARPVDPIPQISVVGNPVVASVGVLGSEGRRIRANRGAELECRAIGGADSDVVMAELHGPGGDTRRAVLSPSARFRGLAPGRWRLTVRVGARVVERRELELPAGRIVSYVVRVSEVS